MTTEPTPSASAATAERAYSIVSWLDGEIVATKDSSSTVCHKLYLDTVFICNLAGIIGDEALELAEKLNCAAATAKERQARELAEARLHWLHDCSTGTTDPEGCEWGIYRVKWVNGKAVEVWATNSDFSDLDAEMERERQALAPALAGGKP
jgi:hypothetical protein